MIVNYKKNSALSLKIKHLKIKSTWPYTANNFCYDTKLYNTETSTVKPTIMSTSLKQTIFFSPAKITCMEKSTPLLPVTNPSYIVTESI